MGVGSEIFNAKLKLYQELRAQAERDLGQKSDELQRYEQEFQKEFFGSWEKVGAKKLFSTLNASRVLFFADFHGIKQSQKLHVRILKKLSATRPRLLLAEFFFDWQQSYVDQFFKNEISEEEFLKKIDWNGWWGFPWEHYRQIVQYCKDGGIPIRALGKTTGKNLQKLHARDVQAAKIIVRNLKEFPRHQLLVIFGEFHMAQKHLPREVRRAAKSAIKTSVIFQNIEHIYFQAMRKNRELKLDFVALGKSRYCVLSVAPWVKWHNYLLFLEKHLDPTLEESTDFTEHVLSFAQLIAIELKTTLPRNTFGVFTASDKNYWPQFKKKLTTPQQNSLRKYFESGNSFYVPEMRSGILLKSTVNHAANLASSFVIHQINPGYKSLPATLKAFPAMVWFETMKYFGTKMVNPKRKTETLQDLISELSQSETDNRKNLSLRLALAFRVGEKRKSLQSLTAPKALSELNFQEAARMLGGMFGERLYYGYRLKRLNRDEIFSFYRLTFRRGSNAQFLEMLKKIEEIPHPFQSKTEKF